MRSKVIGGGIAFIVAVVIAAATWTPPVSTVAAADPLPSDALERLWAVCLRQQEPECLPTPTPTATPTATATPATPTPTATPVPPTATPTSTPSPASTQTPSPPTGGFIGPEVAGLPTSGSAWDALKAAADSSAGTASITCDQNNRTHPKVALAAGLVFARTGDQAYKTKVITLVNEAKASAKDCGNAILSLGRQLGAYVMAADYVGYRDPAFVSWVSSIRTQDFPSSHSRWRILYHTAGKVVGGPPAVPTNAPTSNNWGTFALASLTTADAYLRDQAGLDRDMQLWTDYGDGSDAYVPTSDHQAVWECPANYEINPKSCATLQKEGAAVEDASRSSYPTLGNYAAESPQGYVLTAEILFKAGKPSWTVNDSQICRNAKWRERGGNLNYSSADQYVTWVTNKRCGFTQTTKAAGYGRVWGFTDWLYSV